MISPTPSAFAPSRSPAGRALKPRALEGRATRVQTQRRRPVEPHSAGFTLFELLLAVAVFAIVLLAIHSVFYSALSLRNRTVAQLEASVPLGHALEIIKRDLANVLPPGGAFSGPFQSTLLSGSGFGQSSPASSNSYRANLPGAVISPDLYTTTGIIDDQSPWGDIARVTYYLADPTNHNPGRDLVRSVTRNLLPIVQDQPENQWLLGGVEDMLFLFFDGLQWVEDWDSTTAATPLPSALKIQLWLTSPTATRATSDPIELVVPLLVQAGTNQTETTSGGGS
jgi:prepilin-type N-terminal cleavage/methylation domain-containing protein